MYNILYPYEQTIIVNFVYLSYNTLNDTFSHLRVNLGDLPNQIIPAVAMDIIQRLNVWCLDNYSYIWGVTINIPPLSYLWISSSHLYVDHNISNRVAIEITE